MLIGQLRINQITVRIPKIREREDSRRTILDDGFRADYSQSCGIRSRGPGCPTGFKRFNRNEKQGEGETG